MKILKFLSVVITTTVVFCSCEPGSSKSDNAYAEVVSQTDSIQMMHENLMDSLGVVERMNSEAMNAMDTAKHDSSYLATLSRNKVSLDEKKATLNKVKEMVGNFESFESEYGKGEMNDEDVKAKLDEIKRQQDDAFGNLNEVERELGRIHEDVEDMMDRKNEAHRSDGEKMDAKSNRE